MLSHLRHVRKLGAFVRKALVVHNVPVQRVELVHVQQLQHGPDGVGVHEVACCIDHETSAKIRVFRFQHLLSERLRLSA